MALRKQHPVRFKPAGLNDAYDSTESFPGACRSLQNLIFDEGNPEIVICRPGVSVMTYFYGFNTPTFISVHIAIGDMIYGMVSTQRFAGYDEPFAYNVTTGLFVTITNVLAGNIPASPALTGQWVPPTMTVVGTKIIITHPGFTGSGSNTATGATSSIAGTVLTVGGAIGGTPGVFYPGMTITGAGVTANTIIVSYSSGSGGAGTYNVSQTSAVGPIAVTGTGPANFFGVIDIAVPAIPVWNSFNLQSTATTGPASDGALPSVPTCVANFNNRAYFACKQVVYFSDVLIPTQRTLAAQSLTLGDTTPIIALCGLPIQTTSAGISQALTAFKEFQVWQVTGDSVTTNLSVNYVSLTTGTRAPRSVVQTPFGIIFMATNGPYFVDPGGQIRLLSFSVDTTQHDLQTPFLYCTQPSRVSAGYTGAIYRICLDTIMYGQEVRADYWFATDRRRWNGPHTWPVDCASVVANYFVISHHSKGAKLYKSQIIQEINSQYLDDLYAIDVVVESSQLPKDATMTEKQVVESTVELSSAGTSVTYKVEAINGHLAVINTVNIVTPATSTWGAFTWNGITWNPAINIPRVYTIPWTGPLVFQKLALRVSATASSNIAIGSFFARYQDSGYMNMQTP